MSFSTVSIMDSAIDVAKLIWDERWVRAVEDNRSGEIMKNTPEG
jgi:hypothetical protein